MTGMGATGPRWAIRLSTLALVMVMVLPATPPAASVAGDAGPRQPRRGIPALPRRAAGRLAIIAGWTIALVDLQGHIVARAQPRPRSLISTDLVTAVPLPIVSASRTRLYYLDGNSQVRYVMADGRSGTGPRLPGNAHTRVAFAVSPDDRRMAVAALNYGAHPVRLRLYVQDLLTGRRHAFFSSTRVYEWPIGWRGGALVLAVAAGPYTAFGAPNPYQASEGYHVVDVTTGRRLATLCPDGTVTGPVTHAGTPCWQQDVWSIQAWSGGTRFRVRAQEGVGVVAPNGHIMAWRSATASAIFLLGAGGRRTRITVRGYPEGWFDSTHLLVMIATASDNRLRIVDLRTGAVTPTAAQGHFLGVIPPDLAPDSGQ